MMRARLLVALLLQRNRAGSKHKAERLLPFEISAYPWIASKSLFSFRPRPTLLRTGASLREVIMEVNAPAKIWQTSGDNLLRSCICNSLRTSDTSLRGVGKEPSQCYTPLTQSALVGRALSALRCVSHTFVAHPGSVPQDARAISIVADHPLRTL
jgi:hypothetical protein